MRARILLVPFLFSSIFSRIASEIGSCGRHHIGGGGKGISTRPVFFRQGQIKDKVSTDLERPEDRPPTSRRTVGFFSEDGSRFLGVRLAVLKQLPTTKCCHNFGPSKKTETKPSRIITDQKSEQEQEQEEGPAFGMSPEADVVSAMDATTQWQSDGDYGTNTAALLRQLAQYKSWRSENGYGRNNARWGRSGRGSAPIKIWKRWSEGRKVTRGSWKNIQPGLSFIRLSASGGDEEGGDPDGKPVDAQQLERYSTASEITFTGTPGEESGRRKRDLIRRRLRTLDDLKLPPKMKEALEDYRTWRSRNGYGRLAGRWG